MTKIEKEINKHKGFYEGFDGEGVRTEEIRILSGTTDKSLGLLQCRLFPNSYEFYGYTY